MADETINQQTEDTSPTTDDFFLTWDTTTGTTKKVSLANIVAFLRTNYAFWEILGITTLGGAADVINNTSFTAKKHLMVLFYLADSGGTISIALTFNNDTGSNYSRRVEVDGAADTTSTSASNVSTAPAAAQPISGMLLIDNPSITQEKLGTSIATVEGGAGAAAAPSKRILSFKWSNTANQITRIDLTNGGTGDYAIGSQLIILGHD